MTAEDLQFHLSDNSALIVQPDSGWQFLQNDIHSTDNFTRPGYTWLGGQALLFATHGAHRSRRREFVTASRQRCSTELWGWIRKQAAGSPEIQADAGIRLGLQIRPPDFTPDWILARFTLVRFTAQCVCLGETYTYECDSIEWACVNFDREHVSGIGHMRCQ